MTDVLARLTDRDGDVWTREAQQDDSDLPPVYVHSPGAAPTRTRLDALAQHYGPLTDAATGIKVTALTTMED